MPVMSGDKIEAAIRRLGTELWAGVQDGVPGIFDKQFWAVKLLDWAMQDADFKVDLFRLVDVLPALRSTEDVQAHLQEYLLKEDRELPKALHAALQLSAGRLTGKLTATALRKGVLEMAHRFIVGDSPKAALPTLRKLHDAGLSFTVDLLGEATLSDGEADVYERRYLELIETLPKEIAHWEGDELIDANHHGALPRANVSLKVSALDPHLDPVDPEGSVRRLLVRLRPMMRAAMRENVFVNIDLEQREVHDITYRMLEELCLEDEFRTYPHLGIVVQAYLRHADPRLDRMLELAKERGAPITIRLVKGAYWDFEVIMANQQGRPSPVFLNKAESDANFERLTVELLKHHEFLPAAFGSHNLRSIMHAVACAEDLGLPKNAYEIQMLYGMAEPIRNALRERGHRVRVYCPIGELLPGMAYFVRRLLENTANEGFLRQTYHERTDIETLLEAPKVPAADPAGPEEKAAGFTNCALMDFASPVPRDAFGGIVHLTETELPIDVPFVVNGEARRTREPIERRCPSDYDRVVAKVNYASREDAQEAVDTAAGAWPGWRDTALDERAGLLMRLADRLEGDRLRLAALQVYEVAKPWREADADVAEAIDFCRYYARRAKFELGPEEQGGALGEINTLFYEGRGPTVIIAPWNFPMAILCGMTTAALVAGNTVIIKPSGQSCAVAYSLFEHMQAAGFPASVAQFLPCSGRDVGAFLVDSPQIAQIAFTGSKEVGLSIVESAARTHPGQKQVKRVVCEMGGKNAVLIDEDADLDEAVAGVVKGAFGYAGQKCSACSRVLVVGAGFESFVARLREATKSLTVCAAELPECQVPPVVDQAAYDRLMSVIDAAGEGAELLYRGEAPEGGWFVPPTLFRVEDPAHRLMQEELFGPVLAIMHVASFSEGLDVALNSEFALTGGVFSRQPSHLDEARRRFRVGNLYLNRTSTGAIVGRQPFGGFNMSGIGTKAGGPGYLQHFADPRCVTENTMRRGFSPEVSF